jgi:N-acetylmuramic acid 6-phosphate etherase
LLFVERHGMADTTSPFVIGVDGGGSKTEAVVADRQGAILGRGAGGSSNYLNVGLDTASIALQTAIAQALQQAGLEQSQISAATWALAGVGREEDRQRLGQVAARLLPAIPVQIENDALGALMGGLGTRRGVVLIGGTGMIVYGEDGQGGSARAGGWGTYLDQGSGYALARAALSAIACAADHRDHRTGLTGRILAALGLASAWDLPGWLYNPGRSATDIAALTPHLLAEAGAGDMIAVEIMAQGAEALANAVAAAARQLRFSHDPFRLALCGGLLTGSDLYRQTVIQAVHTRLPHAQPQLPQSDPATGAALIALESLNLSTSYSPTPHSPTPHSPPWSSETRNILSLSLDQNTTLELIGLMHLADQQAVAAARPVLPIIAQVVEAVADRMRRGGRLIYVGAGTSGRLGVLDASECPPTFNTDPAQVRGLIAGGPAALTQSQEGAEDDRQAGANAIVESGVGPDDSIIGVAASGRTPYVIAALETARKQGALTVALTCNLPAPLTGPATYVIAPLVGPEVITGSTRLKAGTAQKLVLNMISTGVMVRLGKTYGNLMVDVQPTNQKLQARARRIVAQACNIDEAAAAEALAAANGEVKTAIVSRLLGCSVEEAGRRLEKATGVISDVLRQNEAL